MHTYTTQQSVIMRWWPWYLSALGFIICLGGGASLNGGVVLLGGVLGAAPVARWAWRALKIQGAALDQARRPVLSPAQIEAQLRTEGYNPSISDVMAVHQELIRQRNEGLVVAGGMLLGSILVAHQAKGGRWF